MSKKEKLQIEEKARAAINKLHDTQASSNKRNLSEGGPIHEFDIFQEEKIIGGVSTSPYLTTKGNPNTGGRDRAIAELLWLSLWQGKEKRVHVLTCSSMAQWLFKRFVGANFPFPITIYWYCLEKDELEEVGGLNA